MEKKYYKGLERRTYYRILYNPTNRPVLIIGENKFDIADISEGGIRLINSKMIRLDKRVRGTTFFLYGGSLEIEGNIVWEQNEYLGLLLREFIPSSIMEKEKQHVILRDAKPDNLPGG